MTASHHVGIAAVVGLTVGLILGQCGSRPALGQAPAGVIARRIETMDAYVYPRPQDGHVEWYEVRVGQQCFLWARDTYDMAVAPAQCPVGRLP